MALLEANPQFCDRLDRLRRMLSAVLAANDFQRDRLGAAPRVDSPADFRRLPLCAKAELADDARKNPPFGSNLTYPPERYARYHQTSGTTGAPLRILDTAESWEWWLRCWAKVLDACGVTGADRAFFAFSFAPFIGFWSAFDAVSRRGALTVPGGGADSSRRLRILLDTGCTALFCTPTYALHLAETARREGIDLAASSVRCAVLAGEPGGSIPAVRQRIAEAWGAVPYDHAGASEIGAYGIPCPQGRGMFVNEEEFIAEVLDPATLEPVEEGETGELVLTNLGRWGCPAIRYRTGDTVRPRRVAEGLLLEGGILGRCDEMILVRSVNLYPAAIEEVIRRVAGTAEFRITARREGQMDEVDIELEAAASVCGKVRQEIRNEFGIRAPVRPLDRGALPRWQGKARRFRDLRAA